MKRILTTIAALTLSLVGGPAIATCGVNPITGSTGTTNLSGLTNQYVCATRGNEKWQEQHKSGGDLWDYKKGPTDPVDPSGKVGTWSRNATSVTYTYDTSYTYRLYRVSGTCGSTAWGSTNCVVDFCIGASGAAAVANASFQTNGPCP